MKFSILTALLLGTFAAAQAADDLASAFKEGKLDGRLRAHYIATDWDENSATGVNGSDAHGLAVGGSLIYKTASLLVSVPQQVSTRPKIRADGRK